MTFIKRNLKAVTAGAVLLLPAVSFAASTANFGTIQSAISSSAGILNDLVPFIISIGLLMFLIGVVQYVTAGGDEEKRAAARGLIIFGIIALFVMVSVWGFVNILAGTFFPSGSETKGPTIIPTTTNYPN